MTERSGLASLVANAAFLAGFFCLAMTISLVSEEVSRPGAWLMPGLMHDHLAGVRGGQQAGCMADAWADA